MDRTRSLTTAILAGKELLSSRTIDELGDSICNYLLPILRAQGCYFGQLNDGVFDLWNSIVCVGPCAENQELYSEYYCMIDPLVRAPYSPYPFKVYVTDDVIGDNDGFERGQFYNEFLKPMSIRSHLFVNLSASGHFIGTLVLTRDSRSPRFGCVDKRLAALLEPYLSAAMEKTLLLDQSLQVGFVLSLLLEEVPSRGIVVLDPSLRPIHRNHNSEAILSMFYQPGESREGLPLQIRSELALQMKEMEKAQLGSPPSPPIKTFDVVPPGRKPKVRVSVRRTGRTRTSYYVLFLELDDNGLPFSRQLEQYHLTDREVEIASCICKGMRNNHIAERLCISDHTVANHLNHIFQKLGINSRTALCQLVLGRAPQP
jgi:DNA-binding CsgD family transcriptional regulator